MKLSISKMSALAVEMQRIIILIRFKLENKKELAELVRLYLREKGFNSEDKPLKTDIREKIK